MNIYHNERIEGTSKKGGGTLFTSVGQIQDSGLVHQHSKCGLKYTLGLSVPSQKIHN